MLEIRALSKSFAQADGEVEVLKDLQLNLLPQQTAALRGESGSGKSTLLSLIAGLDRPDQGDIIIDSKSTSGLDDSGWNDIRRSQLGLVFQQYHLVPTLTVKDNLKLQAKLANKFDEDFFHSLTNRLGLDALLHRLPHQLSGGQQQRVAIGRALMHRPKLVLADEPTGNLDESTSRLVMEIFLDVVRTSGSALLMVTHSREMASFLDNEFYLQRGQVSEV